MDRLPDRDDRTERLTRALAAARRGFRDREGATDVSVRHDDYLSEAFEHLVTHNYVVVESTALIQARMGTAAVRAFLEDVLRACEVRFVGEPLHARPTSVFLAGLGRRPSFVDRVSFEMMREHGIRRAFAFGHDLRNEGFETVP